MFVCYFEQRPNTKWSNESLPPEADVKSGDSERRWKKEVTKQRLERISGSLFK